MLARHSNTCMLAVEGVQLLQVREHDITDLGVRRWFEHATGREEVTTLPEHPPPTLCRASDHDAVGAGMFEYCARFRAGVDVAIRKNRNRHRRLDGTDRVVFGNSLIVIGARPTVDRESLDAGALGE